MRISVNLATRPFVELRPLFARLRMAMVCLTALAVGSIFALSALNRKASDATREMHALEAATRTSQEGRAVNEARMRLPENQGVLARSQFLNALYARKSFSWTAVMMDLERVLPSGVQVTSIEPAVSKTGEVEIRLRVVGDRDRALQLVRNLEGTQRFVKPRLGGETAVAADKAAALGRSVPAVQPVSLTSPGAAGGQVFGNDVEFEIFSGYNPLPETAAVRAEQRRTGRNPAATDQPEPPVHHQRRPPISRGSR